MLRSTFAAVAAAASVAFAPVLALALLALPAAADAQQAGGERARSATASDPTFHGVVADEMVWSDLEIPGLAPGLKIAVLHGDPSAPGEAYTLRLILPDGYEFPVHYHPMDENVTVLTGTFYIGMGDRWDDAALNAYEPGDFFFIRGRELHFARAEGVTILQAHGVGPFDTVLVR